MSMFDTARDLRLPGVEIEAVYINTSQLTTRMKNAVKRMLRSGRAHGGWQSHGRQLTVKLADSAEVRIVSSSQWGFYVPQRSTYGTDQIEAVMPLLDADEALYLLADAPKYRPQHADAHSQRVRDNYNRMRDVIRSHDPFRWVSIRNAELATQIIDVFANTRDAAMLERMEKLCDRIDAGERIRITVAM